MSDPPIPRGARHMFGVKDLFTTVNVLGGVFAIYYCIRGQPILASYAVMIGYVADALDGLVARLMKAGNRFGAEYDSAADFLAQAIAPAFVIYLVYRDHAGPLGISTDAAGALGLGLAAVLVVAACIRQARSAVRPVAVDFAWIGMPRPVASFILLGFANSTLFIEAPGGLWLGAALVVTVAVLELANMPFVNHRNKRMPGYGWVFLFGFFSTTLIAFLAAPRFAWDVLFFWTFGYSCVGWITLWPDQRAEVRRAVREAKERLVADEIERARPKV